MSKKVDRETLATSIIPQLWTMSIGPQLSVEQFQRFMRAIEEMGDRVKAEREYLSLLWPALTILPLQIRNISKR